MFFVSVHFSKNTNICIPIANDKALAAQFKVGNKFERADLSKVERKLESTIGCADECQASLLTNS